MFSKRLLKYVQSLHQSKFRQKYDKFIAQGPKIAIEILNSSKISVEYIFATQGFIDKYQELCSKFDQKLILVNSKELQSISTVKTAKDVLIVCDKLVRSDKVILKNEWVLYLDRVQDPGNVGTIIRIADWFAIKQVILGPDCADLYNPKVVQSTMGGFLRVMVSQYNLIDIPSLDRPSIYATTIDGKSIKEETLQPGVIVIGNESKGIQQNILDASDKFISIPKLGGAESLNAAVACGIIISAILE